MKFVKIIIDYADGRFSYCKTEDPKELYVVRVAESTIQMWEAIEKLDREMQAQLQQFDDLRILAMEE